MNQTNTLSEILILLKEANKDQRKTLFKNILNNKIDKKAFIYTKDFYGDKKTLDVKKIYYKTLIKRKLNKISDNDKNMLSKIFNEYNNQQLKIDEDIKKVIKKYLGSSTIISKLLIVNYYYVSDYIKLDRIKRTFHFYDDCNYYISKTVSKETREMFQKRNIYKLKDLKDLTVEISNIEYSNICRYYEDLNTYYLNDSLFKSLLEKEELELLIKYLDLNSFVNLSKEIPFSTTELRARIYTITKKLLKFFDTYDGIRVLDIIFAYEDCQISVDLLKEIFPNYYKILVYLAKEKYLYNIYYDKDLDVIKLV